MSESSETNVMEIEEQIPIVMNLLKEYAEKLSRLNEELLEAKTTYIRSGVFSVERIAWLLDQGEFLRKPLSQIISRGSVFLEHLNLDSTTKDELVLRMREIEIHIHHMTRLASELRHEVEKGRLMDFVSKLRFTAGLNAMKGGPLRPE